MGHTRKKKNSTNVTTIVDWVTRDDPPPPPLPPHEWVPQNPVMAKRWSIARADSRFQRVEDYKFSRVRGMVVHESVRLFKEEYLPYLHLHAGKGDNLVLLWYNMRFDAFQSIREVCRNMAEGDFPQVNVFKENLIYDALERMQYYLNSLFDDITSRFEKNQKIDEILDGCVDFLHEEHHSIELHGMEVNFTPDWLQVDPEFIYLADFKGSSVFQKKDRLQVLLYAYLLEICYYPKKVRKITIHYLGEQRDVNIPFTDETRKEADAVLRCYLRAEKVHIPDDDVLHSILSPKEERSKSKDLTTFLDGVNARAV